MISTGVLTVVQTECVASAGTSAPLGSALSVNGPLGDWAKTPQMQALAYLFGAFTIRPTPIVHNSVVVTRNVASC